MGKRAKRVERCERCRLHRGQCMCSELPSLSLGTRLTWMPHALEAKKSTNTGFLAALILSNSASFTWGGRDALPDALAPDLVAPATHRNVVLTHAVDAVVLGDGALPFGADDDRPINLIVPDGTWRQASKMPRRVAALKTLPRVILPPGPGTRYFLREETKDGGLATFEAIARALGILEGAQVQATMERIFERMIATTLASRGRMPVEALAVYGPKGERQARMADEERTGG